MLVNKIDAPRHTTSPELSSNDSVEKKSVLKLDLQKCCRHDFRRG
jgi:hypothetical protein